MAEIMMTSSEKATGGDILKILGCVWNNDLMTIVEGANKNADVLINVLHRVEELEYRVAELEKRFGSEAESED